MVVFGEKGTSVYFTVAPLPRPLQCIDIDQTFCRRNDPTVYHIIAGKCMAIIFNNRLLWEGGVVYHLRRPSSTGCQIVKRGFSENKDETVKQDMLLLTKYKLHTFDGFLFFFSRLSLLVFLLLLKRVWSVHRQLDLEPI